MNHASSPLPILLLALALAGCALPGQRPAAQAPAPTAPPTATLTASPEPTRTYEQLPTATPAAVLGPKPGLYRNRELGVQLRYPASWDEHEGGGALVTMTPPDESLTVSLFVTRMERGLSLQQAAEDVRTQIVETMDDVVLMKSETSHLSDGQAAWTTEFNAADWGGGLMTVSVISAASGQRLFHLMIYGSTELMWRYRPLRKDIRAGFAVTAPVRYGIPADQALLTTGSEFGDPAQHDPALGRADRLVFSGLTALDPQLRAAPDLAERWEVSDNGTVYTFHLREGARFHNGRPVTAADVIYSWERAADPRTGSRTVLTYLGDIVGMRERRAGEADSIAGLRALDDRTLEVRIGAAAPTFALRLSASPAVVLDRANVAGGGEWWHAPNGTGPYRLLRWEPGEARLYERFADFYLGAPAIRYVVQQLGAYDLGMYEAGEADLAAVDPYSLERIRDPREPLHRDLRESVSMCTDMVLIDTSRAPFDDPKVREALSLAVDRQRYVDAVTRGASLPAAGLYPPGLPGHGGLAADAQAFDPTLARQALAESRYGGPDKLPEIVYTASGYGSDAAGSAGALASMWREHLGVKVRIELVEPGSWDEALHARAHGQLMDYRWCADYPDPENFAEVLFHSGSAENLSRLADPELDALLERARAEQEPAARVGLYQQAEQQIAADTPAIFLAHPRSYTLVSERIQGFVPTPLGVPIERYLSFAP